MSDKVCGICFKSFNNLNQHLRIKHSIRDGKEFELLLKYGSGRSKKKLDCPICDKTGFMRLDKHLVDLHGVKKEDREDFLREAKRKVIMRELTELRGLGAAESQQLSLDDDGEPCEDDETMDVGETVASEDDCIATPRASSTPYGFEDKPQTEPRPVTSSSRSESCSSQPRVAEQKNLQNVSASQPCCVSCKNVASRLQVLESKVETLMSASTPKRSASTSKALVFTSKGSTQKHEHVQKGCIPETLYGKSILDFEKFILGPRTGRRDIDNARQARSHAQRFCDYMLSGCDRNEGSRDLLFLRQTDKLRTWPAYLKHKGYAATTIGNMLVNVKHFVAHIEKKFQSVSKLKIRDVAVIMYEIKRIQKEVRRDVVVHRQKVKRYKKENQIGPCDENQFLMAAKNTIPELLDALKENPHLKDEHNKVMGYLMGYLCILTGHRSVVMTNMTKENVLKPEHSKQGFHITVDEHKTVRTYGQASLFLTESEYSWLSRLIEILSVRKSYKTCDYVFVTFQGKQIAKPVQFLKDAWRDVGLIGNVTFNQIRSSVSTQASKYLSVAEKEKVAKSMCHDSKTAERFYVALPDKKEALKARNLRLRAMKMAMADAEEESLTEDETTEDESEPVLESEEYSSSTLPSEDSETARERRKKFFPNRSVNVQAESSDEDELPLTQTHTMKRKLDFSMEAPSKCVIKLLRSSDSVGDYHIEKENVSRATVSRSMQKTSSKMEAQQELTEMSSLEVPLEEASQTEVSKMPSGDAPMAEATQSKVSEIPHEDVPLEEATENKMPPQDLVNNTAQDMHVDTFLTAEEMNELVADVVVPSQMVEETQMSL